MLSQQVLLLCGNYLPLERAWPCFQINLNPTLPRMFYAKKVVWTTLLHLPIITQDT